MKIKSKLYDVIQGLKDNRPKAIASDTERIRVKKRKKNDTVDVWLDYKINGEFKEIFHAETTTKCSKGDINDIVEDMALELPKEVRAQATQQKPVNIDCWYEPLTDKEKNNYLMKYQELVIALWLAFYEEGYADDELYDLLKDYGIEKDDLKTLGVEL